VGKEEKEKPLRLLEEGGALAQGAFAGGTRITCATRSRESKLHTGTGSRQPWQSHQGLQGPAGVAEVGGVAGEAGVAGVAGLSGVEGVTGVVQ